MKKILSAALALLIAMPAFAQDVELTRAEQALLRISMVGSQRMLTQRIMRNSCFVAADLASDDMLEQINADVANFDARMNSVMDGNAALGLSAERSPIIRENFNGLILRPWQTLRLEALAVVVRQHTSLDDLDAMRQRSEQLLTDLDQTVRDYEEKYSRSATMSPSQSRTLNTYAAQRMLSQRIAAEFCLIGVGLDLPETRQALGAAFERFDTALSNMTQGNLDARITVPPPSVTELLVCMRQDMDVLRDMVMMAVAGQPPTSVQLETMLATSDDLLHLSQEAVSTLEDYLNGFERVAASCSNS